MRHYLLVVLLLLCLTGGFGVLVPSIDGLRHCGEYYVQRLFLVALAGVSLCVPCVIYRGTQLGRVLVVVLAGLVLSVCVNTLRGQDPFGAWLNWRVRYVNWDEIDRGSESWRVYWISRTCWVTYDDKSQSYYSSGSPHGR